MTNQKLSQIYMRVWALSLLLFITVTPVLTMLYETSSKAPSNEPILNSINDKDDNLSEIKSEIKYEINTERILDLITDVTENEVVDDSKSVLLLSNYDEDDVLPIVEYKLEKTGYVTTTLNIREHPNTDSNKLGVYTVNMKVNYSIYSDEWVVIKRNGKYAYLNRKYISNKPVKIKKKKSTTTTTVNSTYITKTVMNDRRKSYMDYRCITSKSSRQYKLQYNYAYTGSNGVRMINGRYCVALGSYYSHNIGQYVDLILSNGTVIPCIVSDAKANRDTNSNNSVGRDGSVGEFIVDTSRLSSTVRRMGDVSYASNGWNSNVVKIKIYNKNIF